MKHLRKFGWDANVNGIDEPAVVDSSHASLILNELKLLSLRK